MSIPKSLRRRSAIEARLSTRFRAQARMLARYCEIARARGLDVSGDAAQLLELIEAYATTLEAWCLGERTPQALAWRYAEMPQVWSVVSPLCAPLDGLLLAAHRLNGHRDHLCRYPTHAPSRWLPTGTDLVRVFVDISRQLLSHGSEETVLGDFDAMLRAVEREDVERARAEKLPLEGGFVGSSAERTVKP